MMEARSLSSLACFKSVALRASIVQRVTDPTRHKDTIAIERTRATIEDDVKQHHIACHPRDYEYRLDHGD